jgi:hypothetical protein
VLEAGLLLGVVVEEEPQPARASAATRVVVAPTAARRERWRREDMTRNTFRRV